MNDEKVITVIDSTLSKTEALMATIMYTFAIIPFLYYFKFTLDNGLTLKVFSLFPYVLGISFTFIVPAINISEVFIVKLDTIENKIITTHKIVFYEKTKIIEAIDFEYVALNNFGFGTTVTLWYKGNKRIELTSFYKKDKSFLYAKSLCKVLKIDLLDKTDLKKPIWIDYSQL